MRINTPKAIVAPLVVACIAVIGIMMIVNIITHLPHIMMALLLVPMILQTHHGAFIMNTSLVDYDPLLLHVKSVWN